MDVQEKEEEEETAEAVATAAAAAYATEHVWPMNLKLFSERLLNLKSRNSVSSFNQVFH